MICYNIAMKILLHFLSLVLGGAIFVGVLYFVISKAVSTATPESATDEKPAIENRVDR